MYLCLLNAEAIGKQPKTCYQVSHRSLNCVGPTRISIYDGKSIRLNSQVALIITADGMLVLPAWSMQVWRSMSK